MFAVTTISLFLTVLPKALSLQTEIKGVNLINIQLL